MKRLALVLFIAACSSNAVEPTVASGSAVAQPAKSDLKNTDVRLLAPDAEMAKRSTPKELAAAVKNLGDAVASFDLAHPAALPARFDAAVVWRRTGTRVWLIADGADLPTPVGFDEQIAKMPLLAVKERHVALIVTFARPSSPPDANANPTLPSAWTKAAKAKPMSVDDVVDVVWPN